MAGIGDALRSTRERRGLSIDEVARETRISPRFLEALEAEQFAELPAPVYVRGFLRSYANYLRIDPQPLLDHLIGGDMALPGATAGYIGGNGRNGNGKSQVRKNDPFQRGGVVAGAGAPPLAMPQRPRPPEREIEDDSWAPEALAPFTVPHEDHGYVPGSDLMEAPERRYAVEETPRYQRRTSGVLAERPPRDIEPGVSRRVALFGGGVLAVLAFLGVAVVLTRGDGDGNNKAAAIGGELTPGITPGSVIPLGTRTASPPAGASASAVVAVVSSSATAGTAAGGTATPQASPTAGTATATNTPGQAVAPTTAPTATPTSIPATATPVPTPVPPPPHPSTISACDTTLETNKCGSSVVRVICYPPFAQSDPTGRNNNYFVDVTGVYPLQDGWRESYVNAPLTIGPVIAAGRSSCQ